MPAPKRQPRPSEVSPPKSLAERFAASYAETKALGEELVQNHVQILKQMYPSLPLQTLMADTTKFRDCFCQVASEVVQKDRERAAFGRKP